MTTPQMRRNAGQLHDPIPHQPPRRPLPWLCLGFLTLGVTMATLTGLKAAAEPATPHARIQATADDTGCESTWEEEMLWILRWLYEFLGGDPNDLEPISSVGEVLDVVLGHYLENGIPADATVLEQMVALIHLNTLWLLLPKGEACLAPSTIYWSQEVVLNMIEKLTQ